MFGPGAYRPDPTEGITASPTCHRQRSSPTVALTRANRVRVVGTQAYRDKQYHRTLHDLGNLDLWCPRDLVVTYSQHYCTKCRKYFHADLSDLAPPGSQYTHRVIDLAVRLVVEDGLPYRPASWHLWRDHRVFVPFATIQNWVEAGGKKAQARMDTDFLDWALADFSGYVAADEVYDGPFCILSAVDNRRYKRILYDVLDHDPTHDDIRAFLGRLKMALAARNLTLCGVTTDGSALYPVPLMEVFGDVPHQICTFHVLAEVGKAVLGAVASARKGLAATQPKLRRGRPSTPAAKQAARTKKRLAAQGAALFTQRYLFVQRHLNKTERKTLWRVSRGLPQLHALRAVMEQVYALFDRRCRTQTALDKLATLRRRLLRFPQVGDDAQEALFPHLGKGLDVSG